MKNTTSQILVIVALVLCAAILRVFNAEFHIYNLVPIAAIGLFSGSVLSNKKLAILIPLMSMLIADLGLELFTNVQGFYGISQLVNYFALAIVTLLGSTLIKRNAVKVGGYTIASTLIFFILSNFGTFLSGYYGFSFAGLTECYVMAIPFLKNEMATTFFVNSMVGDLLFSFLAFGLFALISNPKRTLQPA